MEPAGASGKGGYVLMSVPGVIHMSCVKLQVWGLRACLYFLFLQIRL